MNNRWVKIIALLGVAFLAVTMIGSFIGRGLAMRHVAMHDTFNNRGAAAQFRQEQGRGPAAAAPQQPEQAAPGTEQAAPQFEQRGRDGRGHHHHYHGHGKHRGGSFIGGIFGFLGGLIRLTGLGLLILAAIVFFRDRGSTNTTNDASDDDNPPPPDMTEAEIRAAMKRLGINKIEL